MKHAVQINTPLDLTIYHAISRAGNKLSANKIIELGMQCHDFGEDAMVCKLHRMIKSGKLLACIDAHDQSVILSISGGN